MKLTKDKSGIYKAKFYTEHGPREVTTKCSDKEAARKVVKQAGLEQIESAARAGKLSAAVLSKVLAGRKITLENSKAEWLKWLGNSGRSPRTIDNYNQEIGGWLASMPTLTPTEITDDMINRWLNDPAKAEQLSSRKARHAALRTFLDFCAAKDWVFGNPARLVRVNMSLLTHSQKEKKRRLPFTDEEVATVLAGTDPGSFWHSAVAIGRYLGLRLSDIAKLEWDTFAEPGVAVVWTDKRDRRVALPTTHPTLLKALEAIPREHKRFVFPDQRELALDMKRRSYLSCDFSRVCARLGITKSFHSLRHAFATALDREGKPLWYIADAMGHAYGKPSFATTGGYIH